MITYLVQVDYEDTHKQKGILSRIRRYVLNNEIIKVIETFSLHKPIHKHEMYLFASNAVARLPPDRIVFVYRDTMDLTSDIQFEISQLEGVENVKVYKPLTNEDLI